MASTYQKPADEVATKKLGDSIDLADFSHSVTVQHAKGGISQMKAIAKDAIAQQEGVDFGPLSHEDRLNILLGR